MNIPNNNFGNPLLQEANPALNMSLQFPMVAPQPYQPSPMNPQQMNANIINMQTAPQMNDIREVIN